MKLLDFDALGYRSLADVTGITLGRPAFLTGQNDGGKTATIGALRYLLRGVALATDDRTFVAGPDGETQPAAETMVTARLELSETETEQLDLPGHIDLRRASRDAVAPVLEIKMTVPEDERLRDLGDKRIVDLKEVAAALDVERDGPGNMRESWLAPLRRLAEAAPTVDEWVPASRDVERALPVFVVRQHVGTEPGGRRDTSAAVRLRIGREERGTSRAPSRP